MLEKHYRRYHGDQAPVWLPYGDPAERGCYANFKAYLANPDTELVLMPHIRRPNGGCLPPPRPPLFGVSRKEPPVIELPAVSDVESCFFKRSAVDFEVASSWADFHHDGHESRQMEQRCDQKSLKSELHQQQPSQSGPGLARAKAVAAVLSMDKGLAMLEVQPAGEAQDEK